MLHTYFAKIRFGETNEPSSGNSECQVSRLDSENDNQPIEGSGTKRKCRTQNEHENHELPLITAEQYASRIAMLSSLAVAWSPMLRNNSLKGCSILATGAKNGSISLWRIHEPQCYSITQRSKPSHVVLIGFIRAHSSWVTALSWSKFESDGLTHLLLSTGSSDGSVKIWRISIDELLGSSEDRHASFSLLKEVSDVGSGPVSILSLLVPDSCSHKMHLAVGKGSGSLQVWTYDTSVDKFDVSGPHYAHDQVVTGLAWAYDGHCLYSCSQDNSLRGWIVDGDSLPEVSLPSNILGVMNSTDVPNVSDASFGIAISPANLVIAVVRSFDVNLLNPMYQARSQKAAVEFFWIGGQKLENLTQKDPETDIQNFPGFPNTDLVIWGSNIMCSLNLHENLDKPLVVWDVIAALSAFKQSGVEYVEQIVVKWLTSKLGSEWDFSLPHLSNLTSRQLHLLNIINRHVMLKEVKEDSNKEQGFDEDKLASWIKALEMSEKELRERLVSCCFTATVKLASRVDGEERNRRWQPVGLAQMTCWIESNDSAAKDHVKVLASKVKNFEKRNVAEEECNLCSSVVPFEDTEFAFCRAEKCGNGSGQRHRLARCAVSMTICPLSPSWFCVSCHRRVSNLAPESFFPLPSYRAAIDSKPSYELFSKPLCPFCGVLLQRLQPDFLLSTSPV